MPYTETSQESLFILEHIVPFERVQSQPRFEEASSDMVAAVLTEAGRMCQEVLAPLQRNGDTDPAHLENGVVRTSKGYDTGYRAIADGGWVGTSADPEYGGMGLPMAVTTAVNEMMGAACLSLQLKPLLSQGQIEALEHHADDAMKATYLPKLISGEWSGTMNLTEPQAGSDVGALTTKAEPRGDGSYAITGQKIYISWGDSDLVENVCHLVLARLPDGAAGTKGISLFMVPKYIPNADGTLGAANDLRVVSLEHKMGLHGSPTCVMEFSGATGWLVGAPHTGMKAMFTMMNNARLGVGGQGIGAAEAAYQQALAYATDRKQGPTPQTDVPGIVAHADVRRMLMTMKADLFAARAICYDCAVSIDMQTATSDPAWAARAALLTPIAKAFGTDVGMMVSETGVQIHGGIGFIEETGAAQYYRDVRVTAIYEGTNGIQAMDLVGRKMMDGGQAIKALLDEISATVTQANESETELATILWQAVKQLSEASDWMLAQQNMHDRFAGGAPYLRAFARALGGHYHLRAAMADPARRPLARFYILALLPEITGLVAQAQLGAEPLYDLAVDAL
jgi:alkylation response protein AidB-like acyl-CoA dehydrogenase